MDGGYHPGGHFLDDHVRINPKQPVRDSTLAAVGSHNAQRHASAFRPCGLLAKAYLTFHGGNASLQTVDDNIVLVDATRCQNAEELATVLSASINTFPGKDPLKAIGGTFMPSMQNAHKQDRYGWVELPVVSYAEEAGAAATLTVTNVATTLPDYGWLRVSDGGVSGYAPYISQSISSPNTTFTLANSPVASTPTTVNLTAGGVGYPPLLVNAPTATLGGSGAGLIINITTDVAGAVTAIAIGTAGSGYKSTDTGLTLVGGTATFDITAVGSTTNIATHIVTTILIQIQVETTCVKFTLVDSLMLSIEQRQSG
jgi:hypothetical protein